MVFLSETIKDVNGMEHVIVRLNFKNCMTFSKVGHSGGLALLWSDDINHSITSYSSNHINAMVNDNNRKL